LSAKNANKCITAQNKPYATPLNMIPILKATRHSGTNKPLPPPKWFSAPVRFRGQALIELLNLTLTGAKTVEYNKIARIKKQLEREFDDTVHNLNIELDDNYVDFQDDCGTWYWAKLTRKRNNIRKNSIRLAP
jgi:hypothetical protein